MRSSRRHAAAVRRRCASPAWWPWVSLNALKWSRSSSARQSGRAGALGARHLADDRLVPRTPVGQRRQLVRARLAREQRHVRVALDRPGGLRGQRGDELAPVRVELGVRARPRRRRARPTTVLAADDRVQAGRADAELAQERAALVAAVEPRRRGSLSRAGRPGRWATVLASSGSPSPTRSAASAAAVTTSSSPRAVGSASSARRRAGRVGGGGADAPARAAVLRPRAREHRPRRRARPRACGRAAPRRRAAAAATSEQDDQRARTTSTMVPVCPPGDHLADAGTGRTTERQPRRLGAASEQRGRRDRARPSTPRLVALSASLSTVVAAAVVASAGRAVAGAARAVSVVLRDRRPGPAPASPSAPSLRPARFWCLPPWRSVAVAVPAPWRLTGGLRRAGRGGPRRAACRRRGRATSCRPAWRASGSRVAVAARACRAARGALPCAGGGRRARRRPCGRARPWPLPWSAEALPDLRLLGRLGALRRRPAGVAARRRAPVTIGARPPGPGRSACRRSRRRTRGAPTRDAPVGSR